MAIDENLAPGDYAPQAGIYTVSHRDPAHALPHNVRIARPMVLPRCAICRGVRFSYRTEITQPIEDCEFFPDLRSHRG